MNDNRSCIMKKDAGNFVSRDELNCNDVLAGRGGWVHQHHGNVQFRNLLRRYNQQYNDAERGDKIRIIHTVMEKINSMVPPGRYLKEYTPENGDEDIVEGWIEMTHEEAVKKTRKAIKAIGNSRSRHCSPSLISSSPCSLNVVSSTSSEDRIITHAHMEMEQPSNSVAGLTNQAPPEPFISSLSSVLCNHPRNNRRMEYYNLRHEESVLPPPLDYRNLGTKTCRTYSDERKKLMMESSILSSSSLSSRKEGSTSEVAQSQHVSDNDINTFRFDPTPITIDFNTPRFHPTPTITTTVMSGQSSNELPPLTFTSRKVNSHSRDPSPQNDNLDIHHVAMGEEEANHDCDNPNTVML